MKKVFNLYIDSEFIAAGTLDVDIHGKACFFSDGRLVRDMVRTRLETASAEGVRLSGFELKDGFRNDFRYVEWWLAYA